jgi:t-SNARE complex subunit (syntaxin)
MPGAPLNGPSGGGPGSPTAELPDIEVQEDLALIRQRNMDIDKELEEIAAGVAVVKQIAIQMGDELEKQNEMLDTIDTKVEKANDHVQAVNAKMKAALDGVMKGDKFLVNCVLLCILFALVAYITSQLV